jgi:hypothetical protein
LIEEDVGGGGPKTVGAHLTKLTNYNSLQILCF